MESCELMPENETIIKLEALQEKLKAFSNIVSRRKEQQTIELDMDDGTSFMVGLYKTPAIAVARNYASAGCKFPKHDHAEWELLVIYRGEMHLTVIDKNGAEKTKILKERNFYYLDPTQSHKAYFPVESWFLAITMPASENWPEG